MERGRKPTPPCRTPGVTADDVCTTRGALYSSAAASSASVTSNTVPGTRLAANPLKMTLAWCVAADCRGVPRIRDLDQRRLVSRHLVAMAVQQPPERRALDVVLLQRAVGKEQRHSNSVASPRSAGW